METIFIAGRHTLDDASDLIRRFGSRAESEAATRASSSRNAGNLHRFCHWRQIERVIATLESHATTGTVH